MWDWISDTFTSVTNYVAPALLPAAVTYGGARLLGADNQTALITAGLVGAGSKMFDFGVGDSTSRSWLEQGVGSEEGTPAPGGALEDMGRATAGNISPKKGILDDWGISNADLLKAAGPIIASWDDTDDRFMERRLNQFDRQLALREAILEEQRRRAEVSAPQNVNTAQRLRVVDPPEIPRSVY
jgi:hypothetical protein